MIQHTGRRLSLKRRETTTTRSITPALLHVVSRIPALLFLPYGRDPERPTRRFDALGERRGQTPPSRYGVVTVARGVRVVPDRTGVMVSPRPLSVGSLGAREPARRPHVHCTTGLPMSPDGPATAEHMSSGETYPRVLPTGSRPTKRRQGEKDSLERNDVSWPGLLARCPTRSPRRELRTRTSTRAARLPLGIGVARLLNARRGVVLPDAG